MVMDADLSAANAAEEALSLISAGTVLGIGLFVVDPLYGEVTRQLVPMRCFVRVDG